MGFEIHYSWSSVQRLKFHLPGEQTILFGDYDAIDDVVNSEDSEKSMFLQWMEINKIEEKAKELTYAEFPSHFVWVEDGKFWKVREKGTSVGRIYPVDPGSGERYYLRIMLNHIKCPTSYEELRTVEGIVHPTFKEACYALGLLDDDMEYIDGIIESNFGGSAHYIRSLFVFLLVTDSMARPDFVWEKTWKFLSDDILSRQRKVLSIHGTHYSSFILSCSSLQNYD